jgi:hypothetical protein
MRAALFIGFLLALSAARNSWAEEAPQAVYAHFYAAVERGDLREAAKYTSVKIRAAVVWDKDRTGILKPLAPASYRFIESRVNDGGSNAIVVIEAPYQFARGAPAVPCRGSILMTRENGEWRLAGGFWQQLLTAQQRSQ